MSREEKTVWSEEKILPVNQNAIISTPQRRFFSMVDTGRIELTHREYGEETQSYFHELFPNRQWSLFTDSDASPLPVHVEMMYPTVEEPFYLLHTIGMSAVSMHYPVDSEYPEGKESYGELCMILPGDWPFTTTSSQHVTMSSSAAWPIRLLMELGCFPHVHKLWMSYGFILPNTENCDPFSPMTDLSGVMIVQFEGNLGELQTSDGTTIQLYMPFLVYKEEMELYNEIGPDALIERILNYNGESFLLDMKRPNVGLL